MVMTPERAAQIDAILDADPDRVAVEAGASKGQREEAVMEVGRAEAEGTAAAMDAAKGMGQVSEAELLERAGKNSGIELG